MKKIFDLSLLNVSSHALLAAIASFLKPPGRKTCGAKLNPSPHCTLGQVSLLPGRTSLKRGVCLKLKTQVSTPYNIISISNQGFVFSSIEK